MSTKYSRWMSKGTPEIVRDDDNSERLKIYRGLEVPERSIVSEGDNRERVQGIIDLKHPGIDWTPIRAFADDCYSRGKNRVVLSALVPLDDQRILSESRKNSDMHPDDWFRNEEGDYEYPPLERLTDCLIVVVPEDKYHLLREVKIDYAEGMFEIRR